MCRRKNLLMELYKEARIVATTERTVSKAAFFVRLGNEDLWGGGVSDSVYNNNSGYLDE